MLVFGQGAEAKSLGLNSPSSCKQIKDLTPFPVMGLVQTQNHTPKWLELNCSRHGCELVQFVSGNNASYPSVVK